MDCNYYNQGCDGGYSMLVGKFGQEQFLIEDKHLPYQAKDLSCSKDLQKMDQFNRIIKVLLHTYI